MADTALVFDGASWRVTGDIGDNSEFWHACEIVRTYRECGRHGELLAIVRWPDGRVTRGHIVSMMRDVVTPSRTDRQPPNPVAGAKGGYRATE